MFFEQVLRQKGVDAETIPEALPPTYLHRHAKAPGSREAVTSAFSTNQAPRILEKTGHVQVLTSIGKELGRVENTVFFARRSWFEKNQDQAQKLTNAIAKAQVLMKTASDEKIAAAIAPYFPGLTTDIHVAIMKRYRGTVIRILVRIDTGRYRAGLAKLQEVMVAGGVLASDKIVAYEAIVATDVAHQGATGAVAEMNCCTHITLLRRDDRQQQRGVAIGTQRRRTRQPAGCADRQGGTAPPSPTAPSVLSPGPGPPPCTWSLPRAVSANRKPIVTRPAGASCGAFSSAWQLADKLRAAIAEGKTTSNIVEIRVMVAFSPSSTNR